MYSVENYIKKRGTNCHWKIYPKIEKKFSHAMVIPAYGEYEYLPNLLKSIEKNSSLILKEIVVIIIINNSEKTNKIIKDNNKKTYELLINNNYNFSIGIIDAFSKNLEIPHKNAGVGFARKIGMDLILPHLKNEHSLFFSTDADTIIDKNYFQIIINYFNNNDVKAAVVGFKHIDFKTQSLKKEIIHYEKILTETANKIKDSGSPYGYVSMGSAMICDKNAYVSVGGMPKKKATEDFYFLQELTKYCGVHTINKILVYPSSRSESRVYLGTGYRMIETKKGFKITSLSYSEQAFSYLKKWLKIGTSSWNLNLTELLTKTTDVSVQLTNYIIKENIEIIWPKLQNTSSTKFHFINQFHCWFDGLKTIRFLKYFTFKSNL